MASSSEQVAIKALEKLLICDKSTCQRMECIDHGVGTIKICIDNVESLIPLTKFSLLHLEKKQLKSFFLHQLTFFVAMKFCFN